VGFDGVLGEAEGAAAGDFGHEAAAFGAVALEFFVVGAHLAGLGWAGDVVHEALDEAFVGLVFGVELGDGSEGTEVGIEGEDLDGDGVDGFLFRGAGAGAGVPGEGAAGDLEGVEDEAGALEIDGVGGDAGDDVVDGDVDGGAVFDEGDGFQLRVAGCRMPGFGAAGGVVVVAEVLAAQSG
jgi:hypothetical protein